jgi:hypothetical protein
MAHSEGSRGGWRRGRVSRPNPDKYSVGPQNVHLDGSNYRGAQGSNLNDIHRMVKKARDEGASTIWVSTMIRRTSLDRGFRWISSSGYRDANDFLNDIEGAMRRRTSVDKFAEQVHDTQYPVEGALVWSIFAD